MLKYYLYVSATKVAMLYPQIPPSFFSAAEAELKISVGIASAAVKSRSEAPPTELAGRVASVAAFLRKHDAVGTASSERDWFEGTARFRWGVVRDYASDLALFVGQTTGRTVALIGSSESMIGAAQTKDAEHQSYYYALKFLNNVLRDKYKLDSEPPPYTKSWREAVAIGQRALPQEEQELEFFARLLYREGDLVIGTPLYVALH